MTVALPGIVSLEQARRLKVHGFLQDRFPQVIWVEGKTPTLKYQGAPIGRWWDKVDENGALHKFKWLAAPFLLSDDPKRPGVVEWFESDGWRIGRTWQNGRVSWYADHERLARPFDARNFSALTDLILDALEVKP